MNNSVKAFILIVILLITFGCGGGGGGGGSVTNGSVTVAIQWPSRSRYIPPYANSVVCQISLSQSKTYAITINRSGDTEHQAAGSFAQGIPQGSHTMTVKAYTEQNGGGSVVAEATVAISVTGGQNTSLNITTDIQTTIAHLIIDNTPLTVRTGNTLQVTAHAVSSTGQVILLPTGALSWEVTSGGASGSINASTGLFTSTAAGTVGIRVKESGLATYADTNVIVSDPVSGSELVVSVDWPGRSRYVPPYANSVVCTLTISQSESYSVTVNRTGDGVSNTVGQFTQGLPAGTYTLTLNAKSLINGGGVTVASASVQVNLVTGQTTTRNITADLQSTINRVVIDGLPLSVKEGSTLSISGHAEDSSNATILLPAGALTWDITSGGTHGSINTTTGLFTATSEGSTTVRLREVGAQKAATATVSVTSSVIPPTIAVADLNNNRVASITSMGGANWTTFTSSATGVFGVAFDSQKRVYWTDSFGDKVYRADSLSGGNIVSYGASGTDVGQFSGPKGIAIDSSDRIYIADRFNNRIVRIDDMTGANWTTLGSFGSGDGNVFVPEGVYVDANNKLYIADTGNNRVIRTSGMTTTGWTSFGESGSGSGQFYNPTGIWVTASGSIYITDTYNNRIVKMDSITGSGWISFGGPDAGSDIGQFNGPEGIAVDSGGKIYIADSNNNRIVRLNSIAGLGWISYGSSGSGADQFNYPISVGLTY